MSDIKSRVLKIIETKLGTNADEIQAESHFVDDLGADSLDTVELIMDFEKEFNLTIPEEHAEKITTVGAAIEYLTERSSAA